MRSARTTTGVLTILLAVLTLLGAGSTASAAQVPLLSGPNVVVLMVDDLPQEPARRLFSLTPNIRALFLDGGQRWTNMFANDPLCCPGRASFLTGLWSRHHGVRDNEDPTVFQPEVTVATALHERGYWTGIVGKYMNRLNVLPDKTPPGWDRVAITAGGYWTDWWIDDTLEVHRDKALPADYHTDVLRDQATRFLREAPQSAPVFLLLSTYAPHAGEDIFAGPIVAPRHLGDARCQSVGRYKSPAYAEADVSDKPDWVADLSIARLHPDGWPLMKACRALLSVDEMLGAVVGELQLQGRFEDTLFMLVADNGIGWGDHRLIHKAKPYATHIPLWMRWDARLADAPAKVTAHASMVDLAPT
nr:sulfatase-like hydrolase/transferase [Chloroflexota bacterium]